MSVNTKEVYIREFERNIVFPEHVDQALDIVGVADPKKRVKKIRVIVTIEEEQEAVK